MLLSFIIPAYNCCEFIGDCLDSLLLQGLKYDEYEVVIVDDGSTDDTAETVAAYCAKYPNFRMLQQINSGSGAARNAGIAHAQGRYLHFMDADDRLLPGGMRLLLDKFVLPLDYPDVISFWSRTVDRFYKKDEWETIQPYRLIYHGGLKEYGLSCGVGFSVWNQLVSRELIDKYHIRFSDHKIGEDMFFMLRLYNLNDAILAATDLNIYRYYVRESSAMNNTQKDYVTDVFNSLMDLSEQIEGLRDTTEYSEAMLSSYLAICRRWAFTRLCSANLPYSQLKSYLDAANEKRFFEASGSSSRLNRFIDRMSRSAFLSYLFACFYGRFFMPYIKPWIKRN